jgi:hypothetical protein
MKSKGTKTGAKTTDKAAKTTTVKAPLAEVQSNKTEDAIKSADIQKNTVTEEPKRTAQADKTAPALTIAVPETPKDKEIVPKTTVKAKEAVKEHSEKVYAIKTDDTSHLYAPMNEVYNFGTGDFTVEAMVKTSVPGTMLARKGEPAGAYNGGFLFLCTEEGELKFVTDDGEGYYEVISEPTSLMDNTWHHVLAVRQNGEMNVYLDFVKQEVIEQSNRPTPLNVDNGYSFTVAVTDQYREPFDHMEGQLTDIRVWNIAKIYKNAADYNKTQLKGQEKGLVGWWNFKNKDGQDSSKTGNALIASGKVEYIEK